MRNEETNYTAMVSGTAEVALLYPLGSDPKEDAPTHIIEDTEEEELEDPKLLMDREIRMRNLHDVKDWELVAEGTLAEIRTKLRVAIDTQCVLHLLLMVFKPECKANLLVIIEDCLSSSEVQAQVRKPFMAIPFSEEKDWESVLQATEQAGAQKTLALLHEMQEAHAPMQHFYDALRQVLELVFGPDCPADCRDIAADLDLKNEFIHLMGSHDIFRLLGKGGDFDTVLAEVPEKDKQHFDNFDWIIGAWKQKLQKAEGEND